MKEVDSCFKYSISFMIFCLLLLKEGCCNLPLWLEFIIFSSSINFCPAYFETFFYPLNESSFSSDLFVFLKYLFIWLHWVLVAAQRISNLLYSMRTLSCGIGILFPDQELNPGPCIGNVDSWPQDNQGNPSLVI